MPKHPKTRKAVKKRFKVTAAGKVVKRKSGQNHYNAKESGKVTRNKRRDVKVENKKQSKLIKQMIKN